MSCSTYQTAALRLREHEVHDQQMEERRDDQHEEKLPCDLVERNGAGDQENDIREVQATHSNSHTLTANVCRENLGQIQELTGIHKGAPEGNEQEDEEDGGSLTSFVHGADKFGLKCYFADQGDHDATETNKHESAPADLFDEEGTEDVAREGRRNPAGNEEERHVPCHSKGYE